MAAEDFQPLYFLVGRIGVSDHDAEHIYAILSGEPGVGGVLGVPDPVRISPLARAGDDDRTFGLPPPLRPAQLNPLWLKV